MHRLSIITCAAVLAIAPLVNAQPYPTKPIRLIVPYPPGGPNDIFARLVAQKLSESMKQQVVVDNRSGGSGIIGAELGARAAPDGYTLLLAGGALLSMNPVLLKKLPYDPLKDYAPVSLIATSPFMLVVNGSLPVSSVQDLVALAKRRPGQLNFASAGVGGPPRLAAELFKHMTSVDLVHIPYNGGSPALTAVVSGEVQLFFSGIASALPLVRDGKLKGLAVTSTKRTGAVPNLPTIAESGVPGYEVTTWYAIVAPAATPKFITTHLNAESIKAVNAGDVRKRFVELAADPIGSSPDDLDRYTRSELQKWGKVVKAAGIQPE